MVGYGVQGVPLFDTNSMVVSIAGSVEISSFEVLTPISFWDKPYGDVHGVMLEI